MPLSRMASSLNELAKTAERIASGDLETNISIRSSKDVLATAIAKMVDNLKQSVDELHYKHDEPRAWHE